MSAAVTCRLARPDEKNTVVRFLDEHWGEKHPLMHLPDLFSFYYDHGAGLQFAFAEDESGPVAVVGYILASRAARPDIWVSIWCAKKKHNGAGLELMAALPGLTGARVMACNNIRPKTMAFYEFLGYTAARLPHYYRLADRPAYRIARVAKKTILPVGPGPALQRVPDEAALAACYTPHPELRPYKDVWYLTRRYFHYPRQQYDVWQLEDALLMTRTVEVSGARVLRVADYVGAPERFPAFGPGIDRLLLETGAEYADCYCAGIPAATMAAAGFAERREDCPNILPNYLTPPLYENTEYYYFTSDSANFLMFKADGDQDRPNIPLAP